MLPFCLLSPRKRDNCLLPTRHGIVIALRATRLRRTLPTHHVTLRAVIGLGEPRGLKGYNLVIRRLLLRVTYLPRRLLSRNYDPAPVWDRILASFLPSLLAAA